jgi:hypothetical protein
VSGTLGFGTLYSGIVLLGVIGLVACLYRRQQQAQSAELAPVATVS